MTTYACNHGMPTAASCVDCMNDGPVADPEIRTSPKVVVIFRARYDGECPECGFEIVGSRDTIAELTNGSYVHERCVP